MSKEWLDNLFKNADTGDEVANEAGVGIAERPTSNCLPDCLEWVQSKYGTIPPRYTGPYEPGWENEKW